MQQHIENIRMRLFDFVEQDHAVRFAAHRFRQIAAFIVADVAGRRTDQARDRMLLHEFRHVDTNQVLFRIKHEFGKRLAEFSLADAGRAEKHE